MSRQHKIWVDVSGGSGKSFGCGQDDIRMTVYVGTSASNSKELANLKLEQYECDGEITYRLIIDGQDYRSEKYNRKTKEFRGIKGRRITGNPKLQAKREKKNSESMMRSVGLVMAMGDLLCDNQKEKNDWKARMLKAGMGNKGLIMPDDWGELSEEEKEKRLNAVKNNLIK